MIRTEQRLEALTDRLADREITLVFELDDHELYQRLRAAAEERWVAAGGGGYRWVDGELVDKESRPVQTLYFCHNFVAGPMAEELVRAATVVGFEADWGGRDMDMVLLRLEG